jgi:hypothetical protein
VRKKRRFLETVTCSRYIAWSFQAWSVKFSCLSFEQVEMLAEYQQLLQEYMNVVLMKSTHRSQATQQ